MKTLILLGLTLSQFSVNTHSFNYIIPSLLYINCDPSRHFNESQSFSQSIPTLLCNYTNKNSASRFLIDEKDAPLRCAYIWILIKLQIQKNYNCLIFFF